MNFSTYALGVLKFSDKNNRHTQYGGLYYVLFAFFVKRFVLNNNVGNECKRACRNRKAGVDYCIVVAVGHADYALGRLCRRNRRFARLGLSFGLGSNIGGISVLIEKVGHHHPALIINRLTV